MLEEVEKQTPAGFLVKVRMVENTYTVFKNNVPEVPRGSKTGSIVCHVPQVVFMGEEFDLEHYGEELQFVRVHNMRMQIPYQHGLNKAVKNLSLVTGSESDLLPVVVHHFVSLEELFAFLVASGKSHPMVVVDEHIPRKDLINLKLKFPANKVFIVKSQESASSRARDKQPETSPADSEVMDSSRIRAKDLVRDMNINSLSKNPVFLSRVHLRNLDFDKMKQILFDFNLTREDCQFIETFLATMHTKADSGDLAPHKKKIGDLKDAFHIYPFIMELNKEEMEQFLAGDVNKDLANIVWILILSGKDKARSFEEVEVFSEWETEIQAKLKA